MLEGCRDFLSAPAYDGDTRVNLNGVVCGADVEVMLNGGRVAQGAMCPWPGQSSVTVGLASPLREGDFLEAKQTLCGVESKSVDRPVGPGVVSGCSDVQPPQFAPPRDGDREVHFTHYLPGSRIWIYFVDQSAGTSEEIGDGSGPDIALKRPIASGEEIVATQGLGNCTSGYGYAWVVGD